MSIRLSHVAALVAAGWVAPFGLAQQGPIPGAIPKGPYRIETIPVATGLIAPNVLTAPAGDAGRQFVVDQPGQVRVIKNGVLQSTPFLDVSPTAPTVADRRVVPLAPNFDERGLIGMAFDPGFANPASPGFRRVFTFTSEAVGSTPTQYPLLTGTAPTYQSVVSSWRVSAANPDAIDTSTRAELMRFDHPVATNHNGGGLAFGPDGHLYVGVGDGGLSNDRGDGHVEPTGNAQSNATPLGKILRIDVNGTNGKNPTYGIPAGNPFAAAGPVKEIYATGMRNPFRLSFAGNDLLVADVGQGAIEEVNRVEAGKNYGWRYKEGTFFFNPNNGTVSATPIVGVTPGTADAPVATMPDVTDPILQYDRIDDGVTKRTSIIGGFVYRGAKLPGMQGMYIFGDFSSGFGTPNGSLYYANLATGEINQFILGDNDHPLGIYVKGIGEDANGELYVLGSTRLGPSADPTSGAGTGVVLAIVPEPGVGLVVIGAVGMLARRRR
jgi:glucose/arabinose dehydrogenase